MAKYKITRWEGCKYPVCEYSKGTVKPNGTYWDENCQGIFKRRHSSLSDLKRSVRHSILKQITKLEKEIQDLNDLKHWVTRLTESDFPKD